jgi:hypothetical protein
MLCNEKAPLSKVIGTVVGSEPPLLTALIEISFSAVGKAVSLTTPPFIDVPVSSHEHEWLCISAKVNELASSYHFSIGCWKCFDSVVFFVFNFTLYQVTFSFLVFC